MRKLITIAAAVAGAAIFAVPAVANAKTTTSNSLSYEFDNGAGFVLQKNTAALNTTYQPTNNYSDAGIVVDLGLLANLPSTGITATGSGAIAENIWLGDGSEAYTPGSYAFPANFSYGFETANGSGSFYMTDGTLAGSTVSVADLQAAYPGTTEVYAWVGVVYGGSSVSGSVSAVNGHATGNRTASFTNNGDGTVTAVLH